MRWLKEKWLRLIIGLLFESKQGKVLFGWLDGHKTQVGRWTSALSAILLMLQVRFPEYQILVGINATWLLVSGVILTELGLEHGELKNK